MTDNRTPSQKSVLWYACLQWVVVDEASAPNKAKERKQLDFHVSAVGREFPGENAQKLVDETGAKFQELRTAIKNADAPNPRLALMEARHKYVEFVLATFPRSYDEACREARQLAE